VEWKTDNTAAVTAISNYEEAGYFIDFVQANKAA
jgi:hypothetical protein